tara:strand:+ start:3669 stop:4736 length:1068 start_codon:yes stop_codon:yes gene_type:complete
MSKMKQQIEAIQEKVTASALDFLSNSLTGIEQHPKYAVIHFAIAIELIFKARLMGEHWSLAVEKSSDADLDGFLSGKLKTVSPREAMRRLVKVCGENIPQEAIKQFESLASHRNRMVHFFHEADAAPEYENLVQSVVKEQLLCWFHLERLIRKWSDQFEAFDDQIASIRWRIGRNRAYLKVKFEGILPEIEADKKKGIKFAECMGCGFEAAEIEELSEVLFSRECRVCRLSQAFVEIDCPDCGEDKLRVGPINEGATSCETCEHVATAADLAKVLQTDYVDPVDYIATNCAACYSPDSVAQHEELFVCTECLEVSDDAPMCGWCSERQIGGGDLEYSYQSGCEFCDGHAGWTKDD